MKILHRFLASLWLLIALSVIPAAAKTPVPAPLTGTLTLNPWTSYDENFPGITLACGKPFHFNVVTPPQYNATAYTYPLYIWLHPDKQGDPWYTGGNTQTNFLANDEGGSYNTTAWMPQFPGIYVLPYADQTNGNGSAGSCNGDGNDAVENWGGWFHTGSVAGSGTVYSGDTGPNTFALLQMITFLENNYSIDTTRIIVNGFSLGAIGSGYLCQHYNAYNGSPAIFSACLESGGGVDEADAPVTSSDLNTMRAVPTWYFGGASDTASPPGDYNSPLCTGFGGTLSNLGSISSATTNQCGTSQMRYTLCPSCGHQDTDASGNPVWTNTTMNTFAFGVTSGGTVVTSTTPVWYNPGADGRFWKLPQQTTAVIDTTSSSVTTLRGSPPSGSVNLAGNYSAPFYYPATTSDPAVTVTGSGKTLNTHLPLGALIEGPTSATDQSIGGTDLHIPGLAWSGFLCTMNTSGVQSSGTVITCSSLQIDWGYGPFMEDATTGQLGGGNVYGCINDYELNQIYNNPSYVIPHMLAITLNPNQISRSGPIWPLNAIDEGATDTGPLPQGQTYMIPASAVMPANFTRGQKALWDVLQQFGGIFYNVGGAPFNVTAYATSTNGATIANQMASGISAVVAYVGILQNQTGPSTAKGMINGVRSDAYPAPPVLDLTPTGGVEVSSTTVGAYFPSTLAPFSVASGGYTNPAPSQPVQSLTVTTPGQQNTGVAFAMTGTIIGYASAPTLNYEVDGGGFGALPAGNTVTATTFTFTVPGLSLGAHTVTVRDANATANSVTSGVFSVAAATESANDTVVTTSRTATTFADNFATLPLHENWQAGDNWQLISPDTPLGRGGTNFGELGTQWWVNPYNPSTPISGIYNNDSNGLHLGLLSTPTADQAYINAQSGSTLPYVAGLLNTSQTNYQQYGYWETTVAVPAIPGFSFQADTENVQITGVWPPEIDVRIYTSASGVQTVLFQYATDNTGNDYFQYTTSSSSGFNASVPHIYGVDWEVGGIGFYIDDVLVSQSVPPTGQGYTSNPMFLYLLTAANYVNTVNPATSSLPASATVRSVNIYATKPVTTASGNLIDATSEVFTVAPSDQVSVNGSADNTTNGVTQMAYVNHAVWYQNVYGLWYYKTQAANAWLPVGGTTVSPLVTAESPNNTVVTTVGPQITDATDNTYAISSSSQVVINGTIDTVTCNVSELAFVNGTVWQLHTSGLWYSYLGTPGNWSAGTTASPLPTQFMTINNIPTQTTGLSFTVSGTEVGVSAVPTLQYQDNAGTWTAFPTGSVVTLSGSTATWSFINPALATGVTNTVAVRDANATSVSAASNGFAVAATETLAISTVGPQTANVAFTVSGTILNASSIPTLQYQDNGGSWVAVPPGGVSLTAFSFTNPGLATNPSSTLAVRDANTTSVTASASFTVQAAPVTGAVWDPANTSTTIALSNGNTTASSTSAVRGGTRALTPQSTGSYCYQGAIGTITANTVFGLGNASFALAGGSALGATANGFGFTPAAPATLQGGLYNGVQVLSSAIPEVLPGVGSMTDSSGDTWTISSVVSGSNVMQTATPTTVPGGGGTSALTILNNVVYGQDSATLAWYTYSATTQNWSPATTPTLVADVAGDTVTECVNLTTQLTWVSSTAMRRFASTNWNNSLTANPSTGVGGVSISGLTCPCYPMFDTVDNASQMTLNTLGPFSEALPTGFQIWQTAPTVVHHPFLYNFGQRQPANDNALYEPVSFERMRR